jgi:DNA-binding winged helix-turn-helix (wHTH) protein/tetratricopeptide (TPR) repeat protein
MSAQEKSVYRFAECELDPRERRLRVRGHPVTLTPKVFDTLVLLVERAGHVVSKDELMSALWPRGFVSESNLTKHIWLIRRALGDGEDEGRCIETVPKLGYRFVAAVQNVPANASDMAVVVPSNSTPPQPEQVPAEVRPSSESDLHDETETADSKHTRWTFAGTAVLAIVIATGAWFGWHESRSGAPAAITQDPGAVAIVDFNNLSGNAKDAWLGPALVQMLATEVGAEGRLHAVSEELVASARRDLAPPGAGGYAPASLAVLQRRLGTRYVLSGAYLVSGDANAPQLRVDLAAQDAATGKLVATLSQTGPVSNLPQLVAQAGAGLRVYFGLHPAAAETLRLTANAQPPSAEVARHLGFALDALGNYDAARARDELLQAVAQAPGYAPAHVYLARAWSMLGYRAKAIAASQQAVANAHGLPKEQQLQIRAQQADLQGDHTQAIAAYRSLADLRPGDPDYRLQLVKVLTAGGNYAQADAALAAVRKLPALASDPRIELAAVQLASAQGNAAASVEAHARRALQLARERGEDGLIAEARLQLGIVLDIAQQADTLLRQAAADFRRIGNPHGEAQAWQNLGNLQFAQNQTTAARETYQRAMAIYQGIGDLGGEAAVYDDLSRMLWRSGDRDGTEAALREALRIGRETEDLTRQAWSLTGLATVESDESASDEVAEQYRQAIALDRQAGARSHLAFALATYADLLRVRGQLDDAQSTCAQAREAAQAFDSSQQMNADFECAEVALDRGDTDKAIADFEKIERNAATANDGFFVANAQLELGQIWMGRGQWDKARATLQASAHGWNTQKEAPGEATASGLLALCDAALGDTAERDAAVARAHNLRSQVTARQEVLTLDIALAELQGQSGSPTEALTALRGYADDAARRQWVGYAFDARLASLRVLEQGNDTAAKPARDALAADARKAGFGWVNQRVTQPRPHARTSRT